MVATAIAAGLGHSCALVSGGAVWCWGNNYHGELGNQAPYGVDPNTIDSSVVPVQVLNINQASSIATGSYHSCAALTTGTGKCWGWSNYGQLGNGTAGTNSRSNVPVVVAGITNAAAMVAGLYHTCALLLDHTVKCWGSNSNGQLGGGNWNDSAVPVTVVTDASSLSPLSQVSALASGKNHVCAVQTSGTVYCWGSNGSGELGRGTAADSDIAAQALGIQASSVGAGESHSCAVTTTGAVQCWGYNYYGALGDNTTNDSLAPVTSKTSSPTAITLGLGANHSCAVLNNASGNVQCWGRNEYGQLGIGSQANSSVPQNVYGLTQATTASGGDWHTCAIVGGGAVYCWGDNTFGQLGDGNGQDGALSTVPTRVHGF
jgi:alpha-tubulin suppressor-like RCC1 family protein